MLEPSLYAQLKVIEIEVSQDIVLSVLLSLDVNKATGLDGIGNII